MPCVTHDLFVGDTIAVSRRDEPGAQAMGAERFSQHAFQPSLGGTFEKDLSCMAIASSDAWVFQPVAITGCFDYLSPQIGCVTRHKFAMLNKERL